MAMVVVVVVWVSLEHFGGGGANCKIGTLFDSCVEFIGEIK